MAITELHTDLFKTFTEKEEQFLLDPEFLSLRNRKMRNKVVDWLIEVVNDYYKMTSPTDLLALATTILDKFLEKHELERSQYQLLGIMALQLAAKYELKFPMKLSDCVYVCANAYTKEDCLTMESTILSVLDYNVTMPTHHSFLSIFLDIDNSSETVTKLSLYLLVKILPEYKMLQFKPSVVASAIIYFSKKFVGNAPYWSKNLSQLTDYRVRDLILCLDEIKQIQDIDFDSLTVKLKLGDPGQTRNFESDRHSGTQ
jgi:hypothetical protein